MLSFILIIFFITIDFIINSIYLLKKVYSMGKVIINENQLMRIVKESVKRILKESMFQEDGLSDDENAATFKPGDIVYWMYSYSSVYPCFYMVTKVGPKSIWIERVRTKRKCTTQGWGTWTCVPDVNDTEGKVQRVAISPNGKAYFRYCGRYHELLMKWDGKPIEGLSD